MNVLSNYDIDKRVTTFIVEIPDREIFYNYEKYNLLRTMLQANDSIESLKKKLLMLLIADYDNEE